MKEYSILIIEDDEDIREGIRILFSGENYRITEAGSGEEGLRLFSGDIDLVILDIMMPGLSGYDVLERLRADVASRASCSRSCRRRGARTRRRRSPSGRRAGR